MDKMEPEFLNVEESLVESTAATLHSLLGFLSFFLQISYPQPGFQLHQAASLVPKAGRKKREFALKGK